MRRAHAQVPVGRCARRRGAARGCASQGTSGRRVAVGLAHPRVAAQFLHQHRGAQAGLGITCWPTSRKPKLPWKSSGGSLRRLEEHLAGQLRVAQFGVALHVGVERAADAAAAAAAGDHDAVDVEELRVALAEPAEVVAVVRARPGRSRPGSRRGAVAFGDAEVFGVCRRSSAAWPHPAAGSRGRRRCSGQGRNPARARARRGRRSTFR